ncbi:MAG: c-type cytochrome [Bacteroidia bacterium]
MKKYFVIALTAAAIYSCGSSESSKTPEEQQLAEGKGIGHYTNVTLGAIDPALAKKGSDLFQLKCTPCHRLTKDKLVGPGLKNVTVRRKPEWIMNMITNPATMTQRDSAAKGLLEICLVQMPNQQFTSDDEVRALLENFRNNDASQ